MLSFGLQGNLADLHLFFRVAEKHKLIVLWYVDDEVIMATIQVDIDDVKSV